MKVEFLESDVLGAELLISAAEFVKAKNSGVEYDSLTHATSAFAGLLGFNYQITSILSIPVADITLMEKSKLRTLCRKRATRSQAPSWSLLRL